MKPTFRYRRHLRLLAGAVAVIAVLGYANPFTEPYLPTFVLCGALHGLALVLSAVSPISMARRCAFVALAASFNAAVLYVGIFLLQFLAPLPAGARLYVDLSVCSGLGALIYGLLIRRFWIRDLAPRAIALSLLGCVVATALALAARSIMPILGIRWFAAAWWFAFSAGLWAFEARRR